MKSHHFLIFKYFDYIRKKKAQFLSRTTNGIWRFSSSWMVNVTVIQQDCSDGLCGRSHCMHHTQWSPRLTSRMRSHFRCHCQGCPTSLMLFPCIFFVWMMQLFERLLYSPLSLYMFYLYGCLRQAWSMFNIILPRYIWYQCLLNIKLWLWASKGKVIYTIYVYYIYIKKKTSIRQLWIFFFFWLVEVQFNQKL